MSASNPQEPTPLSAKLTSPSGLLRDNDAVVRQRTARIDDGEVVRVENRALGISVTCVVACWGKHGSGEGSHEGWEGEEGELHFWGWR